MPAKRIGKRFRSDEERKAIFAKLLSRLAGGQKTYFKVQEYEERYPGRVKSFSKSNLPKQQLKRDKAGDARFVTGYGQAVKVSEIAEVKQFIRPSETGGLVYKIYKKDGKVQPVYNEIGLQNRERKRFASTLAISQKMGELHRDSYNLIESKKPADRQLGVVLHLVGEHGLRIGTSGQEVKKDHYGATTLLAKHFIKSGNAYKLRFIGKSGVPWGYGGGSPDVVISDRRMVKTLSGLLRGKRSNDQVFGNLNYKSVWRFMQSNYKATAKSLRSYIGSKKLFDILVNTPLPSSKSAQKKTLNTALSQVASTLGHVRKDKKTGHFKPLIATSKKNYVAQTIIESWLVRKLK